MTHSHSPQVAQITSSLLFVDGAQEEWQLALAGFAEAGFMERATMVRDKEEALDFLQGRGVFKRRMPGLPAAVVLGPNMNRSAKLSLLREIRADKSLLRVPVVGIFSPTDSADVRAAYLDGANSVIIRDADAKVQQDHYAKLAQYWGWANEPPAGSVPSSEAPAQQP
jgi:DNA-binding response OmpR family regulator